MKSKVFGRDYNVVNNRISNVYQSEEKQLESMGSQTRKLLVGNLRQLVTDEYLKPQTYLAPMIVGLKCNENPICCLIKSKTKRNKSCCFKFQTHVRVKDLSEQDKC